jgi:hypothetical protein
MDRLDSVVIVSAIVIVSLLLIMFELLSRK